MEVPPFEIAARVLEEDSYLILSAEPRPREVTQRPRALLREAKEALPVPPGTVLVRVGADAVELLAVVHDLELEPSTNEEWVALALKNVFEEARRRQFANLALPVLGSHHGAFPVRQFAGLLRELLLTAENTMIERVWLELSGEIEIRDFAVLEPWITLR